MRDDHLRSEHYVDLTGRGDSATLVAHRTHRHLVESCPECRAEWEQLGGLQEAYLQKLHAFIPPDPPASVTDDDILVDGPSLAAQDDSVEQHRYLRRRAYEQLWELRRTPANQRAGKIRAAYRRFRSRALAELLIEESRSLVRTAPEEALRWIDLVPLAIAWTLGDDGPAWAPALLARAAGHRANALRIAGDLPAAERAFIELRRSVAARPLADPAAVAEITSLEASLRMGQQQLAHAEELLDRAALAYQYARDPLGLARARIKQAMLMRRQGRVVEALAVLDQALAGFRSAAQPVDLYLVLCAVTERINGLCDLGRFADASLLLLDHASDFEASEDPHAGAGVRWLEGRIALGQKDYRHAEDLFASSRDALLALGRNHDAALVSLYLAEVLLAQGRTRDLRRLAAQLTARFRSSELPVETLKSLRLFARAVAADTLTVALLATLRRDLDSTVPPAFPKHS